MTDADTAQLVFALALLLMAAHGLGWVASRLRQPRVAGEIIGGLLLGPTLFGLLGTRFARIVLSVAVLEDLVVYVVLNIALARVALSGAERFGVPSLLDIAPATPLGQAYYVVCTLAFFTLPLLLGPEYVGRLARMRGNVVRRSSAVGFQLVVLLVLTGSAALIGIAPIFGALVAGILTADLHPPDDGARRTIHSFSYAFFIPLYFALVGLRLDLVHDFQPLFFLGFFVLACLVKALSCYLGARLAGENPPDARNLAVALNARGGPGIVLASVAFDAEIIDAGFYTSLVMLAIVTSLVAGSLLQRALARGTLSPGSGTDRPSRSSP